MLLILPLFALSCNKQKEDPALRLQYEKQKIEIEHLTKEVEEAAAKVSELRMDDPAPDLEVLEERKLALTEESRTLEAEIRALERKKEEAAEKLESYKNKYPLKR